MRVLGVPLALLCLHWHFVVTVLSMVNYVVYVRVRVDNADIRNAYLAFSVIGLVCYGVVAAPLFVYAYKYADSATHQRARIMAGVAVMFGVSSLPVFVVELVMLLTYGNTLHDVLDGVVFVLQMIGVLVGGALTWFAYMRLVARRVHRRFCYERYIASFDDAHVSTSLYPPRRRAYGGHVQHIAVKPPHSDQPSFI